MVTELVTTVLCSDGVSECPDDSTCCETPDGTWGCCPMPKVEKNLFFMSVFHLRQLLNAHTWHINAGESQMMDLQVQSGRTVIFSFYCVVSLWLWVTVPCQQAVCCEDKRSCCPEGTTCDVQHMKCIASSSRKELPMWAKFPARIRADWENQNQNLKGVCLCVCVLWRGGVCGTKENTSCFRRITVVCF